MRLVLALPGKLTNHADLNSLATEREHDVSMDFYIKVQQGIDISGLTQQRPDRATRVLGRRLCEAYYPDRHGAAAPVTLRALAFGMELSKQLLGEQETIRPDYGRLPHNPHKLEDYVNTQSQQYLADRDALGTAFIDRFMHYICPDKQYGNYARQVTGLQLWAIDRRLQLDYTNRQVTAYAVELANYPGTENL